MKLLLVCFSLWVCSHAQADLPFGSQFAGNYWNALDAKTKPIFLTGFSLGAAEFGDPHNRFTLFPEQIPKLIPLIDAFYKIHPETNMLLHSAIQACLMQLEGRPQAEIDEVIRLAERAWK